MPPALRLATATDASGSDIVIVGGGFAGSLTALLLARQGHTPIVVDQHHPYPPDFRRETFSAEQISQLRDLNVIDCFAHPDRGFAYDDMVNAVRARWPSSVRFVRGQVIDIRPSPQRPEVTLADGTHIAARLIVLATGPGDTLRAELGLSTYTLSAQHSLCLGFTLRAHHGFTFDGMVHRGERAGDKVGYANLFRIGAQSDNTMRVNLFLYDDPQSPRVQAFRKQPIAALFTALPGLRRELPAVELDGAVDMSVTDLYDVTTPKLAGVVLIGDARRTSCPASATGISRILNDVKSLSDFYVRDWLAGPHRDANAMAAFYRDEDRCARDADMHQSSVAGRNLATRTGLGWRLRRYLRHVQTQLLPTSPTAPQAPKDPALEALVHLQQVGLSLPLDSRPEA